MQLQLLRSLCMLIQSRQREVCTGQLDQPGGEIGNQFWYQIEPQTVPKSNFLPTQDRMPALEDWSFLRSQILLFQIQWMIRKF